MAAWPVPWAALLGAQHERGMRAPMAAFTDTGDHDGPALNRPILQRLFGPGILDQLGVRIDAVPTGRTEWPIITAGTTVGAVAEGTAAAAAVAADFTVAALKPKKLTGRFEFTHEAAASVPELEMALRRDLADAITAQMSTAIITGDGTGANVRGFDTALTEPGNAGAVATYSDYAGLHAAGVDGIHASTEREVMSVVPPDVYRHAATVYQTGSGESGSEALARRSGGCMASPYVAETGQAGQRKKNYLHSAGPNGGGLLRGDSVAAVWPTLSVIRDIYTKSSQGVSLVWVSLWDAYSALREDAYARVAFDIS